MRRRAHGFHDAPGFGQRHCQTRCRKPMLCRRNQDGKAQLTPDLRRSNGPLAGNRLRRKMSCATFPLTAGSRSPTRKRKSVNVSSFAPCDIWDEGEGFCAIPGRERRLDRDVSAGVSGKHGSLARFREQMKGNAQLAELFWSQVALQGLGHAIHHCGRNSALIL